jgi:hypothetical protein
MRSIFAPGRGRITPVIDPADAWRVGAAVAIALTGLGISIAWLPAFRYGGGPALLARMLATVGLLAIVWDSRGLGGVLGLALTAMGVAAVWQGQPEPEVPRPRRKGILVGSAITALAVVAVVRGWWALDRIPEQATSAAAVAVAGIGLLGTLSVADRSRVRLRDAVRERFYTPSP